MNVQQPLCAIDIYTFEGGQYSIIASQGTSQVLSCIVSHSLKSDAGGTFTITLAPGGPLGVDGNPSWTQVITPMSFVVIAMQRGGHSNVSMVGVVTEVQETQMWRPEGSVTRNIFIKGYDFSYFFNRFNWATLSFIGGNNLSTLGAALFSNPGFGAILTQGLKNGTPQYLSAFWYTDIMMNPQGIMGKTFVPYQGNQVGVSGAIGARLDPYPAYSVPSAINYMSEDSSWSQKFRQILPFPIYEWFVGTGPSGIWGPLQSSVEQITLSQGMSFQSSLLPAAVPGVPQMIGRINPQPTLSLTSNSSSPGGTVTVESSPTFTSPGTNSSVAPSNPAPYQFTGVNTQNFTALTTFQLENNGFINSTVQFGVNGVRNFYVLNPLTNSYAFGGPKDSVGQMFLQYAMLADPASIHRYGYFPYPFSTYWLNDNSFQQTVVSNNSFENMLADITSRLASYYEPVPLMAQGSVTMELRPDIFAGNLFTYFPFPAQPNNQWTFYIEGVTHSWNFGGPSTTSLNLSRGFPTTVYSDSDLLSQILQGNAQRKDGQFITGLPNGVGRSLEPYTISSQSSFLSDIAKIYVNPQQN